jgi:hypothetical protein
MQHHAKFALTAPAEGTSLFPSSSLIPSDKEQDAQEQTPDGVHSELYRVTTVSEGDEDEDETGTTPTDFDLNDVAIIEDDELKKLDEIYSNDLVVALLHWHY